MYVEQHLYFIGIVLFSPDLYIYNQNRQWLLLSAVVVGIVGVPPRVLIVGVPAKCGGRWVRVRWRLKDMVMEDECVVRIQNLDVRLVLIPIRAGILVCVVVVGVVFSRERSLSVTEVEFLGVCLGLVGGGIFNLGGDFAVVVVVVVVEVEVKDFELVMKAFVRLVWGC